MGMISEFVSAGVEGGGCRGADRTASCAADILPITEVNSWAVMVPIPSTCLQSFVISPR